MRLNENIAISASRVLLVPYDAHHVPRYHQWMEDAAIREATASERLTLEEEYENQVSWREASDKLTFIICEPLPLSEDGALGNDNGSNSELDAPGVVAGVADHPDRMVGDINLFLMPWEDPDEEETNGEMVGGDEEKQKTYCAAEVDIMIADQKHRGKGFGRAAVATFLLFIHRNLDGILAEYANTNADTSASTSTNGSSRPELRELVAKINVDNVGSIALFKSLGFKQRGDVNYFGEIQMVLEGFGSTDNATALQACWAGAVMGERYRELVYDREKLEK
ncbi:GNAT domain-containing protein [Hypoxylon sp. FL1857]|nr:GNAT domain-containing protein [Hypoxylon sp. FL1857]